MKKYFALFLAVYCSFFALNATDVGKVTFEQTGALKVPNDLIIYTISLKSGEVFSQEKLNNDIKALYDSGYFSDVEAKTSAGADGKTNINFKLTNTPRVQDIKVKGNDKFSIEKIMEQIRLKKSDPFTKKLLQESLENIKKLYYDGGYHDATVFPSTIDTKNGDVIVTFAIDENLRVKVNSVSFSGNTAFSGWTLSDEIQTSHSYLNWVLDWGLYEDVTADQDKLRLRNLYWTKGYLDFSVKVDVKKMAAKHDYVDVVFNITEGQPYKIGEVKINGGDIFSTEELVKIITLKKGEVYNYKKEEGSIAAIKRKFDKLGYCNISVKTDLAPDYKTHIVDLVFNITEGQAYNVRNINISGNKITKDHVIRRELPIQPGEPVNNTLIDAGKSRLMAMNYFNKVETYPSSTPVAGEKDVNYEVEEKATAKVSVGAGYSSDDSLVGRLSLVESNFDITDPYSYFRGGGQRLSLLAQIGLQRSDLELAFSEPWLFGIPLRLDNKLFFHIRDYPNWSEQHIGFDLALNKQIGEFNSIGLGYVLDRVKVYSMGKGYSQSFQDDMTGWSTKSAFKLNLQRDTRDDLFNPTSGYMVGANGLLNAQALGGSSNYYGLDGSAHGYWNFLEKMLVLHAGGKVGATGAMGSDNSAVPIYQRYFLGGQNSLRGFKFMEVSPLDRNNNPTGGLSMLSGTVEMSHPIYKWIRGAPFVDVGNAWQCPFQYQPNLNVGTGYGLRILIPQISSVPIRLDLGFPVNKTDGSYSSSPQFYFDVGVDY